MSLEDKFYPEDGTVLTKFDNFMIKSAGKVGEAYQHLTGKSYKDLVKTSYKAAAAGYGLSTISVNPLAFPFGLYSYVRTLNPRYETPLEEEASLEISGRPKNRGKMFRLETLALIPIAMYFGYTVLKDNLKERNLGTYLGLGITIQGIATIPFNFAEYLSKSNVPKPPEKKVWDRVKEKFDFREPVTIPR